MATSLKLFVDCAAGSQLSAIVNTDPKTIYTANATKDRRVSQILVTTNDTAAQDATLSLSDGTTSVVLGVKEIPIASGTNGTDAAVDLVQEFATVFSQVDNAGNKSLDIPMGYSLVLTMGAVTADKTFYVAVVGAAE